MVCVQIVILSSFLVLPVHGVSRSVCDRVSARSFCSYCHNDVFRNQCQRQCFECDHKNKDGSGEDRALTIIDELGRQPNTGAHTADVHVKPSSQDDTCPRAPDYEPCVSPEEANKRAIKCCTESPEIPPACYGQCRFNITLADLYTFYEDKTCPWSAVIVYMRCFMDGEVDLRPCCKSKGVFSEPETQICQEFCYSKLLPEKKPTSFEYVECLPHWQDIFQCYWAGIN